MSNTHPIMRKIGARLQEARRRAKISQQLAAEVVGVGRTQITNLEAGRTDTTVTNLLVLCWLYGADANEVLGLNRKEQQQ